VCVYLYISMLQKTREFMYLYTHMLDRVSVIGIATRYGLEGVGSNPGEARFSAPMQTGSGTHSASRTLGTGSFPRGKGGRDVMLTTHPF
jgi:hypothetical protein